MDSHYSLFYKDKIGGKAVTDSDPQAIQSYGAQILVHYSSDEWKIKMRELWAAVSDYPISR